MNKTNNEVIVNKSIYDPDVSFTLSRASIIKTISMFVLMYLVIVLANIAAFTDGRTNINILMIIALADFTVITFSIGIAAEIIKTKLR